MTIRETTERTIPITLVSGFSWRRSDLAPSNATYNPSRKKLMPTSLCASRSRLSSVLVHCKRHSKIPPDKLSIRESTPNPISAMLPANTPAPMATVASVRFQPSVKYSNRRPARSCSCRSFVGFTFNVDGKSSFRTLRQPASPPDDVDHGVNEQLQNRRGDDSADHRRGDAFHDVGAGLHHG